MVQYKINDLTLASNIDSTMQLETDIGGTTANKINISQLNSYFGNNMPASAANKYVDFVNGSDITGNGTIFNPWQSLQHAYDSITPTINAPITIFIPPQFNSIDTGPITGKPNTYIISQGGNAILPYGITISGGATNDVVYMSNLIIQDFTTSVSWVRNDATQFQMYLNNVQTFGPVILEQQGSGITSTFLYANNCFFSGYTVTAGQVSLFNTELAGSCTYNDSGSNVFFQMSGGNNASSMTFSGGILAEFSGIFSDVGYSITTVTTGSGTPNIQSDSASVPSSLTGPGTLTLISKSQHEAYTPADSSHWSPIPAQVAEALDQLATKATNPNISFVNVSETRSANINMADNLVQRPEIKDYSETSVSVTALASTTIDIEQGNIVNLSQAVDITTLTLNNPSPTGKGCSFTLVRTKDNSATARAITWPASVKWNAGVAPTLSSTANAVDIFEFFTIDAGTTWYGFVAGQAMA